MPPRLQRTRIFLGQGSKSIKLKGDSGNVDTFSYYQDGRWTVIFKTKRMAKLKFNESTFIPIAFSVWDGFNQEQGIQHGITSWFNIYLQPAKKESSIIPTLSYVLIFILFELLFVFLIRKKYKKGN